MPIPKWLYSYPSVGLFESFDGVPIADDELDARIDFAFLTETIDEDEKSGFDKVHEDGCCYE